MIAAVRRWWAHSMPVWFIAVSTGATGWTRSWLLVGLVGGFLLVQTIRFDREHRQHLETLGSWSADKAEIEDLLDQQRDVNRRYREAVAANDIVTANMLAAWSNDLGQVIDDKIAPHCEDRQ